jgi:hypothetical protein
MFKKEIEALKTELRKRPLINTNDRKPVTQNLVDEIQDKNDTLQDEIVTLKLKVADLESEIVDEKHKKRLNYDVTIESIKSSVQEQVLDQKVHYEEMLFKEKETGHQHRVHIQGLEEKVVFLKDQVQSQRERILELEKENIHFAK